MTEVSIPQDGTTLGDATQAPYDADEFALYMAKQIGFGGSRANLGIVRGNSAAPASSVAFYGLDVRSNGTSNVILKLGTALVTGTLYENTADITLSIGANASGNPRIDTVVLRKDYVAQTVRAVVKQGTPAATPAPPALTQSAGTTWEIPLADIAVANGFATIAQTDITPRDGFINDPDRVVLDQVLNNSGGELVTGDVVIWDAVFNGLNEQLAVATTTTLNHFKVAGTWVGRTANGAYGRVLTRGLSVVNVGLVNSATLVTHSVAKQAQGAVLGATSGGLYHKLGTLIRGATGLRLAYIDVRPVGVDYIRIVDQKAQNTAGGGFTSGAWQLRTLNTKQQTDPLDDVVSLAASVFTLTKPGTYFIKASAPGYNVDGHQIRLNNTTNGVTYEGTTEYAPTGIQSRSFAGAKITILSGSINFQLEHRCITTKATDGFGRQANITNEIYSVVEIWRVPFDVQ